MLPGKPPMYKISAGHNVERLAPLLAPDPAALVLAALLSYGPLHVVQLPRRGPVLVEILAVAEVPRYALHAVRVHERLGVPAA
ncbi:hypothetical protein O1611_g606 [Lasiodiplodia mahajangana]|uniref:Uncharacterized protein n=1 Tax=Lasiodiplodia mahajangana TaxID=1108764 RepID=A0ACC2K0N4_9PEZI|nr:hypothetical protein O1611_g606 [Lasiodiplodia mahajangana]